jgi:hypothetical protein
MQNILIIGATSTIAEVTARLFAAKGGRLYLLARNEDRLTKIAGDLEIRGAASVAACLFDANDIGLHQEVLDKAHATLGSFDIVLIAHGTLGDQTACEMSADEAMQELQTNAMSTIALLTRLANIMERQKHGTLAVISSVAGDRGRPSNYVYGTAKAAVTTFCEGLRSRLHKNGVHVLTIKPGIVDTPMIEGMVVPAMLVAKPEQIACDIVKAIERNKDMIYSPWFWRFVMMIVIHIPQRIYNKINI